ncbi:MFS transporter [Novosphingobium resinovorum]|nr:MFS transporter [Novosphingobium resinovorum]
MSTPVTASWPRRPSLATTSAIGCAICLAFGLIPLFMGIFPVFLGPVSHEFEWGLSVFPQAPLIVGLTAAVIGPFVGRLVDRKGVRFLLPAGLAILTMGLFSLSLMNGSIAALYAAAIVVGLGGTIAGPIAFAKVINGWFDRNRGFALALVMSGVPAIATAIAVPVSQELIDVQGWRAAYRTIALIAAVVTIPVAILLVREAQHAPGTGAPRVAIVGLTSAQAFRSVDFFLAIGATCLAIGAIMGVSNHFLAWMAERGVGRGSATLALSAYSLAGPMGPLLGGILADRITSPKVMVAFFALAPVGIASILLIGTPAMLVGMIVLGLSFSSINGFAPYLVSRYFGMKAGSEILAVAFAAMTISMGAGPVLVGLGHDLSGNYTWPVGCAACVASLGLVAALYFRPYRFNPTTPD